MAKNKDLLSFYTSTENIQKLKELAEQQERSLSYIINKIITEYLRQKEQTQNK